MCMVSMVLDYGKQIPAQNWTWQAWTDYTEVIRRLDEIDKKLGEKDCEKSRKWMESVEKRLAALKPKKAPRRSRAKRAPKR